MNKIQNGSFQFDLNQMTIDNKNKLETEITGLKFATTGIIEILERKYDRKLENELFLLNIEYFTKQIQLNNLKDRMGENQ